MVNRSRSWVATITSARDEITEIQEDTPSLTRQVIEQVWDKSLAMAKRQAQAEMGEKVKDAKLTWPEVFEKEYELPE